MKSNCAGSRSTGGSIHAASMPEKADDPEGVSSGRRNFGRNQKLRDAGYIWDQPMSLAMAPEILDQQEEILNALPVAIILCDPDGNVRFWSDGAEGIYGWSAAEMIGQELDSFLEHPARINLTDLASSLCADGDWEGELEQSTRDRKAVIVESRIRLLRGGKGVVQAILIINTDITRRSRCEQALLRSQRLESIGMLTSSVVHDLNSMLAVIMLALHTLERQGMEISDHPACGLIRQSVERCCNLIEDILNHARGIPDKHAILRPRKLLVDCANFLRATFPASIRIKLKITGDPCDIRGNMLQLHQVLMNLCQNARSVMPNGGVLTIGADSVRLDACDRAPAGEYVRLIVTDTGHGIPPDLKDRIFEPFFTTKEPADGTGLGLATVSSIVQSHGGFIEVESVEGKGTRFLVYLPVEKGSVSEKTERRTRTLVEKR